MRLGEAGRPFASEHAEVSCSLQAAPVVHVHPAPLLSPPYSARSCPSSRLAQVRKLSEWREGDSPETMAKKLVVQAFLMQESDLRPAGGVASIESGVCWALLGRHWPEVRGSERSPAEISNSRLCRALACKYEGDEVRNGFTILRTERDELEECGILGPHAAVFADSFVRVGPRYLQPRFVQPGVVEWHDVGPVGPVEWHKDVVEFSDPELTERLQEAYYRRGYYRRGVSPKSADEDQQSNWCDMLVLRSPEDKEWLEIKRSEWERNPQLRWQKLPSGPAAALESMSSTCVLKDAAPLAEVLASSIVHITYCIFTSSHLTSSSRR